MRTSDVVTNLARNKNILSLLSLMRLTMFLWPDPAVINDESSYDFVIVGGGTAGCVIASRLVEMNASVLIIEAGGIPPLEAILPGLFPYMIRSSMDWNLTSECKNDNYRYHKNAVIEMQQGKLLGGSSQVNYMIHAKGIPECYNKWAEIANDESWRYKNICKLFKRLEKNLDTKVVNSPNEACHGTKGKIKIKKYYPAINEDYFRSYRELGHKTPVDVNAIETLGYTNCFFNIHSNLRQSTAYSYLRFHRKNPKLTVLYNATALEILFDDNKNAVGVRVHTENNNKIITVRATKEVIVTAGALKSPQLLMLSGIGPQAHLRSKNIRVLKDLPVGQNFQDNPVAILLYKMKAANPDPALSPFRFPVYAMLGNVALKKGQRRPDYHVLTGVIKNPLFFVQACTIIFNFNYTYCDYIGQSIDEREVHFVTHSLSYPNSRGSVVLKDADPKQNPIIIPNYYSNTTDLDNHANYILDYNKVLTTNYFKRVGAELVYPNLIECSQFKKTTPEYWKCSLTATSTTLHMYTGTCSMGQVVDSKLKVIGFQKLRVADSSVIPTSIGAPVHATTVMVAEKLVTILQQIYFS